MSSIPSIRSLIALIALGGLGALMPGSPPALAETPSTPPPMLRAPEPSPVSVPTSVPTSVPAAGLRIFVDPVTGELTPWPTPQQAGELAEALAGFRFEPPLEPGGHSEGLTRFELLRGGTGIRLDGRFLTAIMVHLGPDGEAHFGCSHDPEAPTDANPPAPRNTAALK